MSACCCQSTVCAVKQARYVPYAALIEGKLHGLRADLGVLGGREDVVKSLLEGLPLSQGPVGVLLMHKDHIFQDSLQSI
jgi:hypothetical protein